MLSARKVLQGSASNIVRLFLTVLIGLVLPPILVRHLSQAEYSAWVLILQLSTYINLMDLGLQTVLSKLVAEHHAKGDREASHRLLSSAFSLLTITALLGICAIIIMVWRVPHLFHQMPAPLLSEVRLSLLLIGFSSAFALPFSPFLSVFTGLQEYGFPTAVGVLSRSLSATALIALTLLHRRLFQLALAMAAVNVVTAIAQFYGWKRYASKRLAFSFFVLDQNATLHLLRSGGVIAIWTLAGLFISGLDTVIVGHFDYANTGFYAIGVTATNFMVFIAGSLFSPLLPAVSAMQTTSTSAQIGDVTIRVSRYCTLILCSVGFPLLVGAFPLLSLWVGHGYAQKSAIFLQILVLGNFVRQLGYPYTLIVIATGKQHLATIAAGTEAIVNIVLSVWLARRIGALGVALGTLVGSFVSVGLHLTVSMRLTRSTIAFSVWSFLKQGLLRPLACSLPLLLLVPSWRRNSMVPAQPLLLALWFVMTLLIGWAFGLTADDRLIVNRRLISFFRPRREGIGGS